MPSLISSLVIFWILKTSLFHYVTVDGKKVLIKYLLNLTEDILFAFLEAYLLVILGIVLIKYLDDMLFNIL